MSPQSQNFIPPYAPQLTGEEGFAKATWIFLRNPLEGFGPLAWNQPIVSVPTFGFKTHVISDPQGMTDVLTVHADKFTKSAVDARILGPATKEGLLSVHGEVWKRQRRAVAPIFRPRHMSDLAPSITACIQDFKHKIANAPKQDLAHAMTEITFDVLASALLGDLDNLDRAGIRQATRRVVSTAGKLRPDDLVPLPSWVPRPMMPGGKRALNTLKRAADTLVKSREASSDKSDLVGLLTSATDPHTGKPLSDRERRDNLIGFFIAGHETTALTLTWAIYLLSQVPELAQRLREEVLEVTGQTGDVSYDHLEDLPLTRAVIDETMRLYPPAPLLNRKCWEPVHILGRDIAPKDHIILNNYIMHRAERLWDDPHEFDPDRFIRDPELRAKGSAFMPFGAGPRICVGAAFAVMEAMMVLATLVRDYEFEVPADIYPRPVMTITLRPEGRIHIHFKAVQAKT